MPMDPRERLNDSEEAFRTATEGLLKGLWTALPGIIQSFNNTAMTCVVQPAIMGQQRKEDGSVLSIEMPLLLDCPVQFQGGGGCTGTFPIAEGDECLVVFSSRCIDSWWQSGGIQAQAELRMHDLSDGFVLPGIRSQPRVLSGGVSTTEAQLRTDTGLTWVGVTAGVEKARVIAGTVYEWFCHQYGQKITWTGGKNYHIDTYDSDAIVTSTDHPTTDPTTL